MSGLVQEQCITLLPGRTSVVGYLTLTGTIMEEISSLLFTDTFVVALGRAAEA